MAPTCHSPRADWHASSQHSGSLVLILYLMQTLVPAALIMWILVAPQRSVVGFWTQAVSTGLGLLALSLTGLLLFPPWWTPWAMSAALVAVILIAQRRRSRASLWPHKPMAWLITASFSGFALFAANHTRLAVKAAQAPQGPVLDVASPLGAGRYLIVNGGTTTVLNAHSDALDQTIEAHRAFRGTAYGVDLVAIDRLGLRADGIMPSDPARYFIFRMPVVAPCSGKIIAAVDGLQDMRVPQVDQDHLAGNHVIQRCRGLDVLLAHFKQGSVRVRTGQQIAAGTVIAAVGNSGATSEPHLHIHAQEPGDRATPFAGRPVAIRVADRFLVRNMRFTAGDRS